MKNFSSLFILVLLILSICTASAISFPNHNPKKTKIISGSHDNSASLKTVTNGDECEKCKDNKLKNGDFEDKTKYWKSDDNFDESYIFKACGDYGAVLTGAGKFWQKVEFDEEKLITLDFWAAIHEDEHQKIIITFYDKDDHRVGSEISVDIDKKYFSWPLGLKKYHISCESPKRTKYLKVEGTSKGDFLKVDQFCLIDCGKPMPVTLSKFDVKKEGNAATLSWATTSESNSDHFDVEQSTDGKKWINVAIVPAKGESKELASYHYTHTNPSAVNLYRLKMVDRDETFAYSSIKNLNFDEDPNMLVYPNPTSGKLLFNNSSMVSNIKIYTASGVLILNTTPTGNEIDLSKLSQGTYFVKINNGSVTRRIQIIK